jgi:hypothetical protein
MQLKRLLGIAGLAVLGLLVAVGISMAAGTLSSQSIGISDEPLSAGENLAAPARTTAKPTRPRTTTTPRRRPSRTPPPPPPVAQPPAPPPPAAAAPSDDGGSGHGRGRGSDDSGSDSSGKGSGDD